MVTLGERLEAAIEAAGKTQAEVAKEAGTTPEYISNLVRGSHTNPTYQLLRRIAAAAKTTVGALNGESIQLSLEDDRELTRFRDWIDSKLATIDALTEPNAEILTEHESVVRERRVADRKRDHTVPAALPFGANLALRAIGESMNGAGILAGDTLYAVRRRNTTTSALDRIVACKIGDHVFVKQLTSRRRRHFLLSANPRYRAIELDPEDSQFQILGIIVGRSGRIATVVAPSE